MDSKIKIGLIGSLIIYYIMNKKSNTVTEKTRHEQIIDKGESATGKAWIAEKNNIEANRKIDWNNASKYLSNDILNDLKKQNEPFRYQTAEQMSLDLNSCKTLSCFRQRYPELNCKTVLCYKSHGLY